MASTKNYLDYILEILSDIGDISFRTMMGEYILYYKGKIIGGIYDNRFLIKPTVSAREFLPDANFELPYDGAKPMLLMPEVEDVELIKKLFDRMYEELY